jgi:hypothetical protein
MQIPGFKRDPLREEMRRISRESSRITHTTRRLTHESTIISSGRNRPIQQVSPASNVKQTRPPALLVEGRHARRKVIFAALLSVLLAWVLFRLMAGWAT